ncbi:MAG TPA: hypothetical protein VFW65_31915 [Pseudonocardiaceae bacterium]|nr:hypothetical protein [Pseudonocardiaceae bacterium]
MVGRPLVVLVREHRTGVRTQFNSNPADAAKYKPEGGEAVLLDVADLTTNTVYCGVLWFNGAIVDGLKGYVASALPVKLFYDTPKSGGNAYINVEALVANELATAQQWNAANPNRFETERTQRAAAHVATAAQGTLPPVVPGAPTTPPAWATGGQPNGQANTTPAANPTPVSSPAPAATGGVDVNDPAIRALLAQIAGQQQGR